MAAALPISFPAASLDSGSLDWDGDTEGEIGTLVALPVEPGVTVVLYMPEPVGRA